MRDLLRSWFLLRVQDEVRKKFNTHPIHKSVLDKPEWKLYWPVRVQGVCKRGVAFGFFFTVVYVLLKYSFMRKDTHAPLTECGDPSCMSVVQTYSPFVLQAGPPVRRFAGPHLELG